MAILKEANASRSVDQISAKKLNGPPSGGRSDPSWSAWGPSPIGVGNGFHE
jgi:hypothetical protein